MIMIYLKSLFFFTFILHYNFYTGVYFYIYIILHLIFLYNCTYTLGKAGVDMNKIIIDLDVVMKEKGISKNSVCKNCNLQRTQLNNYCKNKISRIDLKILARLCEYLKCDLTDILKLVEEEEENS